ncbi:WXG100-like domain-containing protein [Asanoa iriomotensis]|uniref:Outer membrane channel protein CpnT-like N-terminal domain-containing protein n=1 Tax=Asanoa iriomotensis TaxID=234613 RepID=A0ABQ4CCR5_9ACTN|nr:hypothetical protein [Asanoa iriomotensis]GIF60561.1 hypothetical protein Air01nite_66560 [Asanoa iriomotensis]
MGLQLPGELVSLLGLLGYTWPQADEEKLFEMAQHWLELSGEVRTISAEAHGQGAAVLATNTGEAITAFQSRWSAPEAPVNNLTDGATAAQGVGLGLMVAAGIVLALKINVIIQLVILAIQIAQAIATAAVTFGASLAQIPIFKMITSMVLDQLFGLATEALLNG